VTCIRTAYRHPNLDPLSQIPVGLAFVTKTGVTRLDFTVDYMGKNGTWHQVFHGFVSGIGLARSTPKETFIIRNGKTFINIQTQTFLVTMIISGTLVKQQ
jgi:hypothetical protein